MSVVALIPARSNSKGIPCKNWRPLADGPCCVERAVRCAAAALGGTPGARIALSSDGGYVPPTVDRHIQRPPELAQDDTPMIDVVKHAMQVIPGKPDDIWVLLQPSQPLRKPEHIREAIRLLRDYPHTHSVVSVTPWPEHHSPELFCHIMDERLYACGGDADGWGCYGLSRQPTRRQDTQAGWRRDGTVYAFRRKTVTRFDNLYGDVVRPLLIDPEDTCELDTPADWGALERRLRP